LKITRCKTAQWRKSEGVCPPNSFPPTILCGKVPFCLTISRYVRLTQKSVQKFWAEGAQECLPIFGKKAASLAKEESSSGSRSPLRNNEARHDGILSSY
jgi:hypothetical protein